jgi:quercetin dioxygenase-like cupin family protein
VQPYARHNRCVGSDPVHRLGELVTQSHGQGPMWGLESEELNATLLAWPAGHVTPHHVNEERDVLLVVLAGGGTLTIDGAEHALRPRDVALVERGRARRVCAGPAGIRYVSIHRRRGGLQVGRF